ncbi:YbaB/EbfC family nucleoid-associated protein [Streptosporangium sp. OZ121]|uniref:YbaB/EbfC family nucleoid-associated protein n=1 Tax=Streptosporangium sp. OZ121 TaxID=3444183 RepID=UPI003F7AA553
MIEEQTTRMEEVGQNLAEARGRGESAGGHVSVEVLAGGALAALRIDPRPPPGLRGPRGGDPGGSGEATRDAAEQTGALLNSLLEDPFRG